MIRTIGKIDLAGSKVFFNAQSPANPGVRAHLLKKLVEVSQTCFPNGDAYYPEGSFYKPEGDAVYFIVDKPSVAIRAAIDFMQKWFSVSLPDVPTIPDCRVILDRGNLDEVTISGRMEIVGAPLENISVAEKGLDAGRVYVTESVIGHSDRTMVKFSLHSEFEPRPGDKLVLYHVDFLDPRTVEDSSLLHALFVTHPKAHDARNRVLELFLLEFLLDHAELTDFVAYDGWCEEHGYPVFPRQRVQEAAATSEHIETIKTQSSTIYKLLPSAAKLLRASQAEYRADRSRCVDIVRQSIVEATRSLQLTEIVELPELIDAYLAAVFSEVRLMANYFRETFHLVERDSPLFKKYDYILSRALPLGNRKHFDTWRNAFIDGLKTAASENNGYIAAVFHNVLATYYLNRSLQTAVYTAQKLAERQIFIDTNVLYAMLVHASEQYEAVHYFLDRLQLLEVPVFVFPFTLKEYEAALALVVNEVSKSGPSEYLQWDPWLYREYRMNRQKYLNQIEVCRRVHSIVKGGEIGEERYDEIDAVLQKYDVKLHREFFVLTDEQIVELWTELRKYMTAPSWTLEKFYEFIQKSTKSPAQVAHDCNCVANLADLSAKLGADDLGPRLLFITLDRRLARARRKYSFILSSEQFVEFMLPYLFLSDVPVTDGGTFPNKLLSAQLAALLSKQKPDIVGIVDGFLKDKDIAEKIAREAKLGDLGAEYGRALSEARFSEMIEQASKLPAAEKQHAAEQIAGLLERAEEQVTTSYFETEGVKIAAMQRALNQKERENRRLRGKIRAIRRGGTS